MTNNAFTSGSLGLRADANAASMRAVNYPEHAAELREMAAVGGNDKLERELLAIAERYDALAKAVDEVEPARRVSAKAPHKSPL
jgi:hypothetical protein